MEMEDMLEMRRQYYILINDGREEKRAEAIEKLSASGDKDFEKLAEVGKLVFQVVSDQKGPEALPEIVDGLRTLPVADYWRKFIETTGQVLINKARSLPKSKKRSEIYEYGLKTLNEAQTGGFPLSDATIEMLRSIKENGALARMAQGIMIQNSFLSPGTMDIRKLSRRKTGKRQKGKNRLNSS